MTDNENNKKTFDSLETIIPELNFSDIGQIFRYLENAGTLRMYIVKDENLHSVVKTFYQSNLISMIDNLSIDVKYI